VVWVSCRWTNSTYHKLLCFCAAAAAAALPYFSRLMKTRDRNYFRPIHFGAAAIDSPNHQSICDFMVARFFLQGVPAPRANL
jgi:hypothetical protein